MHTHFRSRLAVALAGVLVVLGTHQMTTRPVSVPEPARKEKIGHLVLQIEGNVRELTVTWITPKPSPYNVSRVASSYAIDLLDGTGKPLGSYPLDLSRFDLEPTRIGQPVRVEGCRVWDSRIATLANVPFVSGAKSLQIRGGKKVIGKLDQTRMAALIAKGSTR